MKWPQHFGLILANCMRSGQAKIFLCCILLIQKLQKENTAFLAIYTHQIKVVQFVFYTKAQTKEAREGCNPALFYSLSKVPIPGAFSNGTENT